MTDQDLIQGLKEQRSKSHARVRRLLEKVCTAEGHDIADALDRAREEQALGERIEYQLQNLGGA